MSCILVLKTMGISRFRSRGYCFLIANGRVTRLPMAKINGTGIDSGFTIVESHTTLIPKTKKNTSSRATMYKIVLIVKLSFFSL